MNASLMPRYVLLSMLVLLADFVFSFHPAVADLSETPDLAKQLPNLLFFSFLSISSSHCVWSDTGMSNTFHS